MINTETEKNVRFSAFAATECNEVLSGVVRTEVSSNISESVSASIIRVVTRSPENTSLREEK
jgi:hypothetical protein